MAPVTHGSLERELRQYHREREPQEGGPSHPPSPPPQLSGSRAGRGPAGGPGGQWEAPSFGAAVSAVAAEPGHVSLLGRLLVTQPSLS